MKKEDTNDAIIKKEPVNVETIKHRIFEVRGMRVMLDRDLAELYGVETRALPYAFAELGIAMHNPQTATKTEIVTH